MIFQDNVIKEYLTLSVQRDNTPDRNKTGRWRCSRPRQAASLRGTLDVVLRPSHHRCFLSCQVGEFVKSRTVLGQGKGSRRASARQ